MGIIKNIAVLILFLLTFGAGIAQTSEEQNNTVSWEEVQVVYDLSEVADMTMGKRMTETIKTSLNFGTKSKVKKFNSEYKTKNKAADTEIPLVVLVNGSSASASEIVSGGLQDLDRAVVMGARSFGKGLVQRPLKLTYGTQLKVTISRYFTPSGRCIQSLDYWNRDEDGNAVQKTAFKDFTTRNGRKVQDGGGVLPDIEVTSTKANELTTALLNNNVIFDYATYYYFNNQLQNVNDFKFSATDYQNFKNFVSKSDFSFETKTEKTLKAAMTQREEVIFNEAIENDFKTLLLDIEKSKITALEDYQKEIKSKLEDEIIKRYFYREGL